MPSGENYKRWLDEKVEEGYGIYPLEEDGETCYLSITKAEGDGIPCYSRVVKYVVWDNDKLGYMGTDYQCGLKVYEQKVKDKLVTYEDMLRMVISGRGGTLRATSDSLNEG